MYHKRRNLSKPCKQKKNVLREQAKNDVQRVPAPIVTKKTEQKESYYRSKEDRAADAKRRARIKKIEEEIPALEAEDAALNEALADPAVTSNFSLLTEKCNHIEEIKNLLDALYAEYETLI